MNRNLSQLGSQLFGIWKQLGLNQRVSLVLAAVVVVAALSSLAFWSSRVDFALLYGKLDDAEGAKVIAVLEEMKVPHKVGAGGSAIYVARDKVHLMRMQLAAKGLPRADGVGFEIFDKPNFGISDFVQRANYIRALQGELSRTIGQLDEIEAARVMIVLPENRLLLDQQKRATASVFIRTKGHMQLPPSAVNSIRFLVANSVEGLQPGQVTVVDNRGNVLSENNEGDPLSGLTSNQLNSRRSLEQYLAKKAEGMLEAVLGPGQAVVRVAAEVNFDQITRTEEKFDPESQVVRNSTVDDETVESITSTGNGGAPGVASNLPSDTNGLAGSPPTSNKTKKKTTDSKYEINKVTSNLTQIAGGMKRVSAAVFVAARFDGEGAARKAAPRSREELDKLRRIVQSALGIQNNGDGTSRDEVTLEEMPFNDHIGEVSPGTIIQEKRQFWWNQVQNFIYPGLALGILFVFWRLLKRTPLESLPPGQWSAGANTTNTTNGNESAQGYDRSGVGRGGLTGQPGTISVEAFNRIVRDNPDNLTQALQGWLGAGTGAAEKRP